MLIAIQPGDRTALGWLSPGSVVKLRAGGLELAHVHFRPPVVHPMHAVVHCGDIDTPADLGGAELLSAAGAARAR
jgi:hypothetical protein